MERTDPSASLPIITEIEAKIQEMSKQLEELPSDPQGEKYEPPPVVVARHML